MICFTLQIFSGRNLLSGCCQRRRSGISTAHILPFINVHHHRPCWSSRTWLCYIASRLLSYDEEKPDSFCVWNFTRDYYCISNVLKVSTGGICNLSFILLHLHIKTLYITLFIILVQSYLFGLIQVQREQMAERLEGYLSGVNPTATFSEGH